jgi:hypothetical protein
MDDLPDPTSRVNGSQAPLTKGRAKRLKSPRHGWVWDGRHDPTGGQARYCMTPGPALTDMRLNRLAVGILGHIGRYKGWVALDQGQLRNGSASSGRR